MQLRLLDEQRHRRREQHRGRREQHRRSSSPATGAPELSSITIGALPSADSVTLQIAQDKGFFKQQGLTNVKIITETTTNAGTQGLLSHTMDFTGENYVGMFAAEKAVPNLNLRIVADNSQTSPGLYVLLVPKDSPLTSVAQLKGKKVGFPAPGFNFGSMAADVQMKPYNESSADFTTVVLPFAAALTALAAHQVDAIFTTEPFITIAEAAAGDRVLTDLLGGPLAGFPTACWGTNAAFAQKYPKTVAAFQRAMTEATQVAATNPRYVRSELPKFIPTMKPQHRQRHHPAHVQHDAQPGPDAAGGQRDAGARPAAAATSTSGRCSPTCWCDELGGLMPAVLRRAYLGAAAAGSCCSVPPSWPSGQPGGPGDLPAAVHRCSHGAADLARNGSFVASVGDTMATWAEAMAIAVVIAVPVGLLLGTVPCARARGDAGD